MNQITHCLWVRHGRTLPVKMLVDPLHQQLDYAQHIRDRQAMRMAKQLAVVGILRITQKAHHNGTIGQGNNVCVSPEIGLKRGWSGLLFLITLVVHNTKI